MSELTQAQLEQRRKAGIKHGGEAAVKAIQKGEPLRGLAAQAAQDVTLELAEKGALSIIQRDAIRLQAACDLYWNAMEKACEDSNFPALDEYVKRFGWLAGASLRAWAQVRQEERNSDNLSATVLEAVTGGKEK